MPTGRPEHLNVKHAINLVSFLRHLPHRHQYLGVEQATLPLLVVQLQQLRVERYSHSKGALRLGLMNSGQITSFR